MKRISKDQYFMTMTEIVALRSTCLRHHLGCVIAKNDKIVSTGYNGAVTGAVHCLDKGCIRDKLGITSARQIETCMAVHAEQNALIQAGKYSEDATLYINCTPCISCAKMIVNAGIKRVVIPLNDPYSDKNGLKLLRELGIIITEMPHRRLAVEIAEVIHKETEEINMSEEFCNIKDCTLNTNGQCGYKIGCSVINILNCPKGYGRGYPEGYDVTRRK